jgi:hypothetical protein
MNLIQICDITTTQRLTTTLRKGVGGHRPSTREEGAAGGLAISSVEVAGASSAWRRGGRDDAGSMKAALGKWRRCGRWHCVRVMKQDVHGGDGDASRHSSAPSIAKVVGGVCGGADNLVPRAVTPTSSI